MRGGEKVLEQFCLLFPKAPISTLVARPERLSKVIQAHPTQTSLLQLIGGTRFYKQMMPLFPWMVPLIKAGVPGGIVLSSDASVIKGVSIPEGVPHVCYCHSPPRYLWDLQETYEQQSGGMGSMARFVFRCSVPWVREFDRKAAQRVDHFIANSRFVQERIRTCYGKDSEVIYPPVDVESFDPNRPREDFYLLVSELTPYKRVDLAIESFRDFPGRLVVIGDGPEGKRLRSLAPSNVTFMGRQSFTVLKNHMETCRAFLHPQIEDFGITAVEAQAAGAPVIAFRKGGALETVIESQTGYFFDDQTAESLREAIQRIETEGSIQSSDCREHAERFRPERFREEIIAFLRSKLPPAHNFPGCA
jgi:glycosyltransferase involved in cell wall biosynthesis